LAKLGWLDNLLNRFQKRFEAPVAGIGIERGSVEVETKSTLPRLDIVVDGKHYDLGTRKGDSSVEITVDPTNKQQPAVFTAEAGSKAEIRDLGGERTRSVRLRKGEGVVLSPAAQRPLKKVDLGTAAAVRAASQRHQREATAAAEAKSHPEVK